MRTPLLIEQHFHGAYGVDFNNAGVNEIVDLSYKLREIGIGGFFPTLVTDSVENIRRQISIIKCASQKCSGILGIHLEGIFINPEKKGIHNPEHFMCLKENFPIVNSKPVDETISKTLFERAMIQVGINKCLKDLILSIQYSPAISIKTAISNIAHKIKHGFCGLV